MFKNRKKKRNKGQSMVEFALALPVFLLIIFGIVEFGMLIFSIAVVNGAAREGARYGAAKGVNNQYYNCSGIEGAVTGVGGLIGLSSSGVTIGYDDGDSDVLTNSHVLLDCPTLAGRTGSDITAGDRVSVTVDYTYNPIMRNILGLPVPQLPLSSTVRRLILKDLVIEGAEGILPTAIVPTAASTSDPCFGIIFETGLLYNEANGGNLNFHIANSSGNPVTLEGLDVIWDASTGSGFGELTEVEMNSTLQFTGGDSSGNLSLPSPTNWTPDLPSNRIIANGASSILFKIVFAKGADAGVAHTVTVTVDSCVHVYDVVP